MQNDTKVKNKRLRPLIKIKKSQVDHEANLLGIIKREKNDAMVTLKSQQQMYMTGVEELNRERQSPMHDRLEVLERSVDTAKARWYQALKNLRILESKEKAQLAQLLAAERNLKSIEKLQERYATEENRLKQLAEQKTTDEAALRINRNR